MTSKMQALASWLVGWEASENTCAVRVLKLAVAALVPAEPATTQYNIARRYACVCYW
jgi:hypothetical protein